MMMMNILLDPADVCAMNEDDANNAESSFIQEGSSIYIPVSDSDSLDSPLLQVKSPLLGNFIEDRESDFSKVEVHQLSRTEGNARVYNKTQSCLFCGKLFLKMPRHWSRLHSSLPIIQKLEALPKNSKERKVFIDELRLKGNYKHNISVLKERCGILLVGRRPYHDTDAHEYLPCCHCYGFFHRKEHERHVKACKFQSIDHQLVSVVMEEKQAGPPKGASLKLHKLVLSKMRKDEFTDIIFNDELMLKFGSGLVQNIKKQANDTWLHISQRLRQLARLMRSLEISGFRCTFPQIFKPSMFDVILTHVKNLSHRERNTNTLALKVGYSLKKCCLLLHNRVVKQNDTLVACQTKNFLRIFETEWHDRLKSRSLPPNYHILRLPSADDILTLTLEMQRVTEFLNQSLKEEMEAMMNTDSDTTWLHIACLTLTKLILFNRRRGFEAAKLQLFKYFDHTSWACRRSGDVMLMSPLEEKLSEDMDLLAMTDHWEKSVPLLIPPLAKQAMQVLAETRKSSTCLEEESNYFFHNVDGGHLDPWLCLMKISENCSLQYAELFHYSSLRDFVTTVCQLPELPATEHEWLSNHLGYENRVYFSNFEINAENLAKAGKLLCIVEELNFNPFADIDFNSLNLHDIFRWEQDKDSSFVPSTSIPSVIVKQEDP